ncbi:hypothetical protein [Lactobacillus helveticus]|uniref:hypothetical protein n=1 Tax=Lactobacillus helveticus TaxID=1587 RepID=UPI00156521AC|nr:hypothetical protein [Lactobacillus helveticus]
MLPSLAVTDTVKLSLLIVILPALGTTALLLTIRLWLIECVFSLLPRLLLSTVSTGFAYFAFVLTAVLFDVLAAPVLLKLLADAEYSLVLVALAESAFVALLLLATVAADETALFVSLVLFTVAAVKFPEVVSA